MRLTGGEIVAESLIKHGVPYLVGIPGHGCLGLIDAFKDREDKIKVLQVRHEQSAVHLADGYYRVTGSPLAVFTSIGPGAINTAVGLATAYVDSTAVLVLTGDVHTHMFGRGVLQEIERQRWADFPRILEPIVKRSWQVTKVEQLPYVMHRAFNQMFSGRPGPVLIDLPMDVQADSVDAEIPEPSAREVNERVVGDSRQVHRAAELLLEARRPVILAGGGVTTSSAFEELKEIAEFLGAAVVTTMMGKGVFPEDHPLYGWHGGSKGTSCGNALTQSADVILAVGCRFADETCSSYRQGVTFNIPPTRLIHVDIDPAEIGKNYPVAVGIIGDAKSTLEVLIQELMSLGEPKDYVGSPFFAEIRRLKEEWFRRLSEFRNSARNPLTISSFLVELRDLLDRNAIVVTGAGHPQAQVLQEFPFYEPRTCITSGGFSTMGFTLPAAIGAKLAVLRQAQDGAPDRQVVGVDGDGGFLMTMQELATAVQYAIPVVIVILNNFGWQSIRDLQMAAYGKERVIATEFMGADEQPYSPNFAEIAKAFGAYGERIERPEEVRPALARAFAAGRPGVVEVIVNREYPHSGGLVTGWWDVPVPTYLAEKRAAYERERAEEKLT